MELEEYLKKIKRVSEIEKLYENVFGREEMGKFMKLAWQNVKEDYKKEPDIGEICYRLMIEEVIVYIIALNGKDILDRILELLTTNKVNMTIKPYNELELYYKKYIDILRKFFESKKTKVILMKTEISIVYLITLYIKYRVIFIILKNNT